MSTSLPKKLSVSERVLHYAIRYPSVGECLRRGVINHSALAREIRKELPQAKMPALIAAVRRLALRRKGQTGKDQELDKIFARSRLSAQGGVALLICSQPVDFEEILRLRIEAKAAEEAFLFMEGVVNFTIVCSQQFLPRIRRNFGRRIKALYEDLSLISMTLPFGSVHAHGVSARLNGLLAGAGIPIFQEMTSAGEYFMVLQTDRLSRAIEVLELRRQRDA